MARIFRALSLLFVPCWLFGQAPTAFTVASIKPNKSTDDRFLLRPQPGGGLTATGVTLKMLIMFGYGVAAYQISGAPNWMGVERWDIEAKTEGVQGRLPPDQFNALLRRLIEDRFQLKSRRETKKMPVYALVVTKSGFKPKPRPAESPAPRPQTQFGNGSAKFQAESVAGLAGTLTLNLGRPVIDRTGIKGTYDFTLEWTPAPDKGGPQAIGLPPRAEPARPADSNAPSIFTALQEQLGLKLESAKGPVEIMVINHVERPSEN
jgi:bla regulator protein blaR1